MRIAIILARGGSKRIPRKNVKSFSGRPMISYAIEAARESGLFDSIVVSTDDDEIKEVSELCGAEVPFKRSDALADDFTGVLDVIKDAVVQLDRMSLHAESYTCIYPTVPLLRPGDLRVANDVLDSRDDVSFVIAAARFSYPVQRGFTYSAQDGLAMLFPEMYDRRSQDLVPVYHDAGQFYCARKESWLGVERIYQTSSVPLLIPDERICDIDTVEDWVRAERMYSLLGGE